MNEYEHRIPLFGPYYLNSQIVRIIRTNTDLDFDLWTLIMFSLNMLDSSFFSLLLSTCFFCTELVEGVILSHFYFLGFILRDLLHA